MDNTSGNNEGQLISHLTDRDMLIYNPNYKTFLEQINKKSMVQSELGRILAEDNTREPTKKKETALFYFVRSQNHLEKATKGKMTRPNFNKQII